ncbi:MAG: fumarylacetoacetate hydrolase family protein [Proteobacteria bacterium]|nr:fumarylacetoacetate hydrolase family protein [Pseudomonadota bacterium]
MQLISYYEDGPRIGVVRNGQVWDLRRAYGRFLFATEQLLDAAAIAERLIPADMALFIRVNHHRMREYAAALDRLAALDPAETSCLATPLDRVKLLPPILSPQKFVCCGNSYERHMREIEYRTKWPQDVKISFLKPPSALIAHGETILFPPDSEQWDYETELAIIIGKACSDISESAAHDHIFGYSILNDACIRDMPEWTGRYDSPRGKAVDTFAPFGPWIVPAELLQGNPDDLALRTFVDDEERQSDRTSGLLWTVARFVAFVSRYMRLSPGDVISTGSTSGNALHSGKFLKVGQRVRCEIEGIGVLENVVGRRAWHGHLPPIPPRP